MTEPLNTATNVIDFHVDAASVCWMSIISEWLNQLYFHHSEYLHITFSHRTCSRAKSSQQQHSQSHNNHCKVGKEKIKIHIPRGDKTTHTWVSRGEIFSCLKPVLHLEARPREGVWNTTVVPHPTTSLSPCFDDYTAVHVYIQTLLLLHFYTYTEQKPTPPQGRFFYKPSGRTKDTLTFGWWGGHVHLKQTNSPSSSGVSSANRRTLGQTQKGFIDGKSLCFCSCTFPGNLVANKNGCNTKIIRCQRQKQEQRGLNPPCHGRL